MKTELFSLALVAFLAAPLPALAAGNGQMTRLDFTHTAIFVGPETKTSRIN